MRRPRPARGARSLFGEILDWMLAPLLMLWPVSIAVTYLVAKSIAGAPFDQALEGRVAVLARQVSLDHGVVTLHLPAAEHDWLTDDPQDTVTYQVRTLGGRVVAGNGALGAPPDSGMAVPHAASGRENPARDGEGEAPAADADAGGALGIVRFRDETLSGQVMRVAWTRTRVRADGPDGGHISAWVQVGETLQKRNALANDIIKGVILPQFVILPLVIMLVWFGLARGLAPLHALQARIQARRPDDSSPLSANQAPLEIAPLLSSFNGLIARLEESAVVQKRFIAHAAHQMKTPLAGLRTQAELALRHPVSDEVRRSLEQIAASSQQSARLVTQLLSLARAENATQATGPVSADLDAIAREVVHDWFVPASEKRMDLGYEPPVVSEALEVTLPAAQPVMLREMLNNLIDNAIRYTPPGGKITVRVSPHPAGHVSVEVEDTGPGIPEAERPRVIERFYRILGREGEGSGLGLAIVSEIVAMHQGTLTIDDHPYQTSPPRAGTLLRVTLPRHVHDAASVSAETTAG